MNSLANKRILLGITGGIAAYKCAELTRLFIKAGAEVRVAMTRAATEFITPLTMQALSGNRVHLDLLDTDAEAGMGHIELARWADLILIAPASADFIARVAHGQADDLLSTVLLASKATKAIAPAMNQAMWGDTGTQENLQTLSTRGFLLYGPGEGDQACGDVGAGRLLEPDELLQLSSDVFESGLLSGKHLVITAGPTREAIDPVRYISNHSSGKMGFALATAAIESGARVTLISGPVNLATPDRVKRIDVESADEMLAAALEQAPGCDVFIGVAAVADYRVAEVAKEKLKKQDEEISLRLVKNPDIISEVAQLPNRPLMVGFAAETENLESNARQKLQHKKLDFLFANDATTTFNQNETTVLAFDSADIKNSTTLGPDSKNNVARAMLNLIATRA